MDRLVRSCYDNASQHILRGKRKKVKYFHWVRTTRPCSGGFLRRRPVSTLRPITKSTQIWHWVQNSGRIVYLGAKGTLLPLRQLCSPDSQAVLYFFYTRLSRVSIYFSGREKLCSSVFNVGSGAAQNRPSSCRNDSDCSDSKVCCKTSQRERGCVDPPPKMPDSRLKLDG